MVRPQGTGVCMWFVTKISVVKGLTSPTFSTCRCEPDRPMLKGCELEGYGVKKTSREELAAKKQHWILI